MLFHIGVLGYVDGDNPSKGISRRPSGGTDWFGHTFVTCWLQVAFMQPAVISAEVKIHAESMVDFFEGSRYNR
jgi:hypothetical protein